MSMSRLVPRKRLVAMLVVGLVLLLAVLLNLPLKNLVENLADDTLVGTLSAHKKLTAAIIGITGLAVASWLIYVRSFRLLGAGVLATVVLGLTYGVYKFQSAYPLADVFSVERYEDNLSILLGKDIALSKYDPHSGLVQQPRLVDRAAFPAIDVHFHLESLPPDISPERLIRGMDDAGISAIVNLGGLPGMFEQLAATFHDKYPDRIIMFVKPDPNALERENGIAEQLIWLKKAAGMGARGLKENKSLGLGQRDASGKLIAIDDPRLDAYWNLAAELGWPVLVHTGEPAAFWKPIDQYNERYLELLDNPEWSLYGNSEFPSQKELMAQRERMIARNPKTIFIGAHFGMNGDDLRYAAHLLDTYPNYYVDLSSVVQDLGRQPFSARRFFIRYQDRILFGTDGGFMLSPSGGWTPERMFRSYIEFLETDNEYIEYPLQSITKQGAWRVYGLDLPPDVLEKVYKSNAERLIPSTADVAARLAALEQ